MTRLAESSVRHWDFPRGIAGTSVLVRFGTDHGVARHDLLVGSGLTEDLLADPSLEVEARQELRVVRNLAAALPDAGVAAGREYHATTFGILGFAFLSSPTMRDAIGVALRYYDLSFAFSIPDVTVGDGQVRLALDDRLLPADVARFLVERDLAAILTVIDELVPGGVPLTGLEFRFPEPTAGDRFEAAFGLRPRFGCPANVATFDAAYLDEPLPLANAHTVAMCEAQCRELVARRRARTGTAHDVRDLLTRLGGLGSPMAAVAGELNLSTRTLRRRLDEEGTSFRALLDEVRETLAEELLTKGAVPVEDVAVRLGYAEASSFIHAFKRWKGVTPIAFVRQRTGTG
ncbi:MAG: AraC family transcriptional regulator [Actinophytocola sp.]|uniref:AraC family transcriptional regulator n=1 Tax=Actinophytocola sp. TaxID=1872138 RepID=UPI003C731344